MLVYKTYLLGRHVDLVDPARQSDTFRTIQEVLDSEIGERRILNVNGGGDCRLRGQQCWKGQARDAYINLSPRYAHPPRKHNFVKSDC